MRQFRHVLLLALASAGVYDMTADDLESGLPVPLSYYRGKVMLVVNVASQCGYTESTYKQLNALHARYASRGLAILAFPCNQFGGQEPGEDIEIFEFTKTKNAEFDFFRKVNVNGPDAHPLFKFLLGESSDCADLEGSCEVWAASGECESNPEFMHESCRRSCKLCSAPAGAASPIKWNFETFLVSRSGKTVARWATGTDLEGLGQTQQIEAQLEMDAKDEM